jgi:hypothetical protein
MGNGTKHFPKEEVQMAHGYLKKSLTAVAIRKMQINTTLGFHPSQNVCHQEKA